MTHQADIPSRSRSILRAVFRSRWDLLAVFPAALAAFALLAASVPQRSGPGALVLAIEPLVFIAVVVVLTPVAVLGRARTLALALVAVVVVGGMSFGSEWISLPGSGAARADITVMSWNVQYGIRTPADQAAQLHGVTADLVALVEVEPDAAQAIEADTTITARYPYRVMAPRIGAWGLAVLSRYPISAVDSSYPPACVDLILAAPAGAVHVIVAHPIHADIGARTPLGLPASYDPAERDAEIAAIRTRIDAALRAAERVLVLGDFNTAPSEAEYGVLTQGLRDTHVQVGEGPGWTWRPSRLTFLPIGLLRIDLQLTGGAIYPASTSVDCSLPGDHCRLFGAYEID